MLQVDGSDSYTFFSLQRLQIEFNITTSYYICFLKRLRKSNASSMHTAGSEMNVTALKFGTECQSRMQYSMCTVRRKFFNCTRYRPGCSVTLMNLYFVSCNRNTIFVYYENRKQTFIVSVLSKRHRIPCRIFFVISVLRSIISFCFVVNLSNIILYFC